MDRHTIIFISDNRQEKLATLLEGNVITNAWEEDEKPMCEKVYILPTPVAKLDKNVEIKRKLKRELINASQDERLYVKVFGGVLNDEWRGFLEEYGILYWDFMELPEVVEGNAWITAEAVVAEVLQYGQYSIRGQSVMVMGYGCCGKKIAKILSGLGAKVTVVARREEVRKEAAGEGYVAVDFSDVTKYVGEMNTVINTVPDMVVTEGVIRHMKKDVLVLDIASNPGGTDFEAARKYGVYARLALGLPGIYTTSSSAKLLKNAISKYAPLRNDMKGDRQWIFQIII